MVAVTQLTCCVPVPLDTTMHVTRKGLRIYKGESPGWSSMSDENEGQIWVSFQCSPQKSI